MKCLQHIFSSLYIRHLMQYMTFLSLQKVSVCHSSSVPACLLLCLKYVLPPSVLQFRNYTNLLWEDSILLMENMSDFINTVNCDQYRRLVCHMWRNSPDSLKKTINFMSCWVRTNFINVVKHILRQIPNCFSLLVNSALKARHYIFSLSQHCRTSLSASVSKVRLTCQHFH